MPKLSEMTYSELKQLEGTLYYLMQDNPELADATVDELHEYILDEMELKENEPNHPEFLRRRVDE